MKYRKVDPRIWNDAKFRALSESAGYVFLFLLTHPHLTALGAMRATIPGLAAELDKPLEAFREAFNEALSKGMVNHDESACFIWLPNFLKYNGPESPNVVKAWASSLDLLPECDLKVELLKHVKAFAEGLTEGFREALPKAIREALPKGMPNQEQEQEQKQKQKQEHGTGAPQGGAKRARFAPPTVEEVEAYCCDTGISIDSARFVDHYTAKAWIVGKVPMSDWRAAVRNWSRNEQAFRPSSVAAPGSRGSRGFEFVPSSAGPAQ